MKKIILIFMLYSFSQNLNAQAFSVGDTSCNYILINKVFDFTPPNGTIPYNWSITKNYSIDLDADLTDDILFNDAHNGLVGGSGSWSQGFFTCSSSTGVEFVYQSTASVCASSTLNFMENLPVTTPLIASQNWSTTAVNAEIYYSYNAMNPTWCGHYFLVWPTTVHLGFRKVLTNDTIYGWVKFITNLSGGGNDKIVSCAFKHTNINNTVTPVFTNTVNAVCIGDQVSLTASPSGGLYTGNGVAGNIFNSTVAGLGNWNVYYFNGCTNPATLNVTVNACVGIKELIEQESYFTIFPNPNAGAFEIKGTKEETIFISNELGQLISTKNLTRENNYSVKLSDLQSGIYFVGNKFYRQKVVVIK
jgi:hypothetical protein